jgi:hypothetical protein
MGEQILSKTDFPFRSYDKKLVFLRRMGNFFPLLGTREKNFSFPIRAVNFSETFCTCSPCSVGQDPTTESAKKIFKNSFGLLELEMANLGCIFEKKGHGLLGV